ncbi:ROK family protein [Pedobacter sp. SYP-B3415]|uniref:ROK family protein n=1 Tax=Pedobacter sp. SYP-B3415 TaxID=2496641 RepID=UPI00101DBE86|nr:ROK family transcriptional regulator [Pedobacter sp. SYP-B3415]
MQDTRTTPDKKSDAGRAINAADRKKQLQKLRLAQFIFRNGPAALSELTLALNISMPTCQVLINELLAEGLLERKGKGTSIGGRRPELFALIDGSFYVMCFNLELFVTQIAVIDNNGTVSAIELADVAISKDLSAIEQLYDLGFELLRKTGIDNKKVLGVGFSMPGLINWQTGNNQTYLATGNELSLQSYLEGRFGRPVFIQNDVKCSATAELNYGLARGVNDALVVLMDWGIGLGIVMDGKMRKGSHGFSGEIGHIPFAENGTLCYCGKRGCLETVASGIALTKFARQGIEAGQDSLLNELCDGDPEKIQPALIIQAANNGDQFAINLLSDIGHNLGKGIATLIQLFNPAVIILGGKMADAQHYITIPITQAIHTYSMTQISQTSSVMLSNLGPNAAILGIMNIVVEGLFEKEMAMGSVYASLLQPVGDGAGAK